MLAFVVMEHFKRSVKTAYYSVNLLIPRVYFIFSKRTQKPSLPVGFQEPLKWIHRNHYRFLSMCILYMHVQQYNTETQFT